MSALPAVPASRDGFSLVELIIALVILTIGLLGMAGASTFSLSQVRGARYETQRGMALEFVADSLRAAGSTAAGFDAMTSLSYGSAMSIQGFKAWFDVGTASVTNAVRTVTIYTEGPRYGRSGMAPAVRDTFPIQIFEPYQ